MNALPHRSGLDPIDAASCRTLAAECGRWANHYASKGETQEALNEIEYARTLCLKALKFEQEQVSARGTISAVESAGGVSPPASPAANSSSASLDYFSGIGSARETSAMPQPGVVDGPTASLAGPASGDSVERHATNLSGSAARGQAALSGECPAAPSVEQSSQETTGNSGTHRADGGANITMKHEDIRA